MKQLILCALISLLPGLAMASAESAPYKFKADLGNEASLQRGAAAFVNYCSGCHSLKYIRYNRLAQDLGIPEDLVMKHLAVNADSKPGDTIQVAMPPADGANWFGRMPPDLTLAARARGADWIYSYLLTFYLDSSRPNGVNNLMLPGLSMPHVLGELQGWQKLADEKKGTAGEVPHEGHGGPKFEMVQPGSMDAEQYEDLVHDITNFLVYTAEPAKLVRFGLGIKVIFFLLLFTALAYLLKREFWKDVH